MKSLIILIASCAGPLLAAPALPELPAIPAKGFFATDFGVKADSSTDNAVALQAALDSAAKAGGGVLHLPAAARPYLTGPVVLKSNTDLRIDSGATLRMLPYGRYPRQPDSSFLPWISANGVHDIAFSGQGTLEGDGADWWKAFDSGLVGRRPEMIRVYGATRASVTGLRLRNAPNVHVVFRYKTTDVTVKGVGIRSPGTSPNTDGFDIEGLRFLFDRDSIQAGDDNIAIQPNHDSTSDITVRDCFLGTGHGLSIGSWCLNGVSNLLAVRDTFAGTTAGIRMKSGRDRGGDVRDLLYTDIQMTDVQFPIYITSYYPSLPSAPASDTAAPVTSLTPEWRNIRIANLRSASAKSGYNSVVIYAVPEAPVESLTFENVAITSPNGFSIAHSHAMSFASTTWNGSASKWFGTARDTSWRRTTAMEPRRSGAAREAGLEGRYLFLGKGGPARVRLLGADGGIRNLPACAAPCSIPLPRATGADWIEIRDGRGTVILSRSPDFR